MWLRRPSICAIAAAVGLLSVVARAQDEPEPRPAPDAAPAPETKDAPPAPETKDAAPAAPTVDAPRQPEPPPPAPARPIPPPPAAPPPTEPTPASGFSFGSYGRMIAATDGKGRAGRDADIVAHGSRLDESNYVELELRRDDFWTKTNASTRLVATLALANPVFHYDGDFDVTMAVRNLYLEEKDFGAKGLRAWAGSRMLRGDDIYLLDFWPLDNLNTVGGGVGYEHAWGPDQQTARHRTSVHVHMGLNQPDDVFFTQTVSRPAPLNQFGATDVRVLDRQKWIGSFKLGHLAMLGRKAGLKGALYTEMHRLPEGQREQKPGLFERLPADDGYVIGAQMGAFAGERDGHVNLFLRYASGLAAYGDFVAPTQLSIDRTTEGAREALVALGGNWEIGFLGIMAGAYFRSFRNASADLDFGDVDEGIFVVRPHVFFGEHGGIAVEGSFQAAQRGVLVQDEEDPAPRGPLSSRLLRFGIVPFLSPAGRGDYSRPHIRLIWTVTSRNADAKKLYPQDDVFGLRDTEHFFGIGAEWWFNSSSYGG